MATSQASSGAPGAGAIVNPADYNGNMSGVHIVAVVSAVLLFTFLALPRTIKRFTSISFPEHGWFLYSSTPAKRASRDNMSNRDLVIRKSISTGVGPWVSHVSSSRAGFMYRAFARGQRIAAKSIGDFSISKLSVMAAYLALILAITFYRADITVNTERAGWVAVSQIPVIFALGTKNNIIGALIGQGYERVRQIHRIILWVSRSHTVTLFQINWVHRWVGQLMFLSVIVHTVGMRTYASIVYREAV